MENHNTEIKKQEWKRTTFEFFDGKAWIYKKLEQLEQRKQYGDNELYPIGHYCYNCKNELIFKPRNKYDRDNPPFRFHKLLVKVLEKKEDDWRTGRKTHSYYAFCCKCALKDESDGTIRKNKFTKNLMGFEMEKCDCELFITKELKETNESIETYKGMVKDCDYLIEKIDGLRYSASDGVKMVGDETFKGYRIKDFINDLKKRKDDALTNLKDSENYLNHIKNWEIERKRQINDYDTSRK